MPIVEILLTYMALLHNNHYIIYSVNIMIVMVLNQWQLKGYFLLVIRKSRTLLQ
jgi:hypothetical protein